MEAIDIVRVVVIVMGLLSGALSAMSMCYFLRRNPPPALVVHVRRVTLTYIAFVVYGIAETSTHFGKPVRWQPFATLLVFTMAANAQVPLVRFEKNAKRSGEELSP